MSADREVTRIVRSWLEEGVTALPDRVLDAVLDQVPATQQRRAIRLPRRLPTMNTPIRIATAAVICLLAVGGGLYLIQPGRSAVGGPRPAPTPQVTATSGATAGGSGSAHYEITGPDAASGDVKFASSAVSYDPFIQSVLFQDGSSVIRINFPHVALCTPLFRFPCGRVGISTATLSLQDAGWRDLPLPGGPSCTWDTASLTANGGTGTVECTNAVNRAHPTTPDRITITFTYQDPSPG